MKNNIIKILFFAIVFTSFGCSSYIPKEQNNSQTKNTKSTKEIPEFEFPDTCFNRFVSKDEKNNIYFVAEKKLYKMNATQELTIISDLIVDNKYLIMKATYYNGNIYLLVLCANQNKQQGLGVAKMDSSGHQFQYLFDVEGVSGDSDMFIYNHNIYFNPNSNKYYLKSYSLENSYNESFHSMHNIFDERDRKIKTALPQFTYTNRISHIYNDIIYMVQSNKDGSRTVINYNPKEDKYDKFHLDFITKEFIALDLIDSHWFIFTKEAIFQYDIHFENCKKIMDICSPYEIHSQGNGKYDVY